MFNPVELSVFLQNIFVDSLNININSPTYVQQNLRSGCCTGPETFHERCMCHADISYCEEKCDRDPNCKGYVGEKGGVCHIATNSTCPSFKYCERQNIDENNDLSANATCGSKNFEGCYIKQKGTTL